MMEDEELEYQNAKRIIEADLAWHQAIENKLIHAGIDKKDISNFIFDAINEKLENIKTKNGNKVVAEG